jgi:hypothetical protein
MLTLEYHSGARLVNISVVRDMGISNYSNARKGISKCI